MGEWPGVSVVMPVRDGAQYLPASVAAVLAQDYPGPLEVVLAIGPSSDGTEEVAADLERDDDRVVVVPNPAGTTPAALNRAIERASGEVVARIDAHSEIPPRYLTTAVEVLFETRAANVGGVQRAEGTAPMQRAVAAAMSSRFGTGDARFHYGGEAGPVDTVYLGVFRADVLRELGGFDEDLIRNQDYELNIRLGARGDVVWFDPRLEVVYRPRSTLRSLASQYWQYGRWKQATLRRHPRSLRWRQLVPPVTLVANVVGLAAAPLVPWSLVVPGAYLAGVIAASVVASRRDPALLVRLPAVFATMHHCWAAGLLVGPPRSTR